MGVYFAVSSQSGSGWEAMVPSQGVTEGLAGWCVALSSPVWKLCLEWSCVARAETAGGGEGMRTNGEPLRKWDGSCLSLPSRRAGEALALGYCGGAGTCEHVRRGLLCKKRSVDSVGD